MSSIQVGDRGVWRGPEGRLLWGANGQVSLESADTLEQATEFVARFETGSQYWCAGCREWHGEPYAGSHFAGRYCATAWESYKKSNSRVCGLCRRPLWDCYC